MVNTPHGGSLKDLLSRDKHLRVSLLSEDVPGLVLTDRQLCDLELILNGGFSPLEGFLDQQDYESVVDSLRLKSGVLWTMPITLDVSQKQINDLKITSESRIKLINPADGQALGIFV
jgi:sulfate adenylyltransferase